jgi:hypothetical protein
MRRTPTPHRRRVRDALARRCVSSRSSLQRCSTKASVPTRPRPPSSPTTPGSMATEWTARRAVPCRSSVEAVRCVGRANLCGRARSRSPNAVRHGVPSLNGAMSPGDVRTRSLLRSASRMLVMMPPGARDTPTFGACERAPAPNAGYGQVVTPGTPWRLFFARTTQKRCPVGAPMICQVFTASTRLAPSFSSRATSASMSSVSMST